MDVSADDCTHLCYNHPIVNTSTLRSKSYCQGVLDTHLLRGIDLSGPASQPCTEAARVLSISASKSCLSTHIVDEDLLATPTRRSTKATTKATSVATTRRSTIIAAASRWGPGEARFSLTVLGLPLISIRDMPSASDGDLLPARRRVDPLGSDCSKC